MSRNRNMKDKRSEAQRQAEALIAQEKQRRSALMIFFIALIAGLAFWTAAYFIWRAL